MKKHLVIVRIAGLILGVAACSDDPVVVTRVTAHQITDAADFIGGSDPVGGIGDWYMANDLIELIVDDPSNQNGISPTGGNLVDFALLGQDNDQLNQIYQLFTPSQDYPAAYDTISAKAHGDVATITVTGKIFAANPSATAIDAAVAEKLAVTTVYTLHWGDPKVYVTTTVTNNSGADLSTAFGKPVFDVVLWGRRSMVPFAPYLGRGFLHPPLDVRNPLPAFGGYSYIAGRSDVDPPVSYAMMAPSLRDGLITGVNTEQVSALGQRPVDDGPLPAGGSQVYERIFLIGAEATIDSVARQAFAVQASENPDRFNAPGKLAGKITGVAPSRPVQIVVVKTFPVGDEPWNATRPADDGSFDVTLPAGDYELRITFGNMPVVAAGPFTVTAGKTTTAPAIAAPGMATVNYTILSDSQALPARLTFKGVAPTTDPILGHRFSGASSRNVAYSIDGTGSLSVEPGTYHIYASRGLEYSLARQLVTLTAGDPETLSFDISKVVDTTGMISVDAHIHSGVSFDSSITFENRVLALAGEGVEVPISTDHDFISDWGPTITALGLDDQMTTIVGVEVTGTVPTPNFPLTIGHNNGWPMTADPSMVRNGAPPDEDVDPAEVYERMRAIASGTPVIQLNHPRAGAYGTVSMGYLDNYDFNPTVAIPATDDGGTNGFLRRTSVLGTTENFDFDCMEVYNGASWSAVATNQQNRDDWLSFLKQGFIKTGMANSDTHMVAVQAAGWPRNYVTYAADTPVGLDIETLNAAILSQKVIGTSGPILAVTVSGDGNTVGVGETLIYSSGTPQATVSVHVEAAPWIPVEEIRVLLNGTVVCAVDQTGVVVQTAEASTCPAGLAADPTDPFSSDPADALRYNDDVVVDLTIDSFIIVEAGAKLLVAADLDDDGVLDTWDTDGDGDADIDDQDTNGDGTVDALDELPLPPFAAPSIPDAIVPGLLPMAFTNPIFLDLGGGWDPPGL
ncbi:MAG: CehA/McbA family metallohydrolase [Myxococcota bacterium]